MKWYTCQDIEMLESRALQIRKDVVNMVHEANAGHPGGSLSAADIIAALFFWVMKIDPENPKWPDRDRFILSKGHSCPALYAALANRGFFDRSHLHTLRKYDSILQGHPDMKKTPGVDMTAGSLGHGLSAGIGMALAGRFDRRDYRIYVMLGDGEIQEGIVWEAAMSASHYHLNNLVAIVDYNGLQINGTVNKVMNIDPLADKFKAFGWQVIEIDGHNMREILNAFFKAHKINAPVCIIANTVKGCGVSYMENNPDWHGKAPNDEETAIAMAELDERR